MSADVGTAQGPVRIEYRVRGGPEPSGVDFQLPLLLLPAMHGETRLELQPGASPRQLAAAEQVQDIYACWYPELERVEVRAERGPPRSERALGVACFFSGGLDSWYTLLRHESELSHLVFVRGLDILPSDPEGIGEAALASAERVAAELGKSLIVVETDLRGFSEGRVRWGGYHGAAMASVGLLLQDEIGTFLVPSGHTYAELFPRGSHPLLDPLWGTEGAELVHDGSEASRIDKAGIVGTSDLAMELLRVCWENRGGAYNCGVCPKCVRTMVDLRAAGLLERCRTLPHEIDLAAVAASPVGTDDERVYVEQDLRTLEREGREPELQEALRAALARDAAVAELERRLARAERTIDELKGSASWRLTAPLRALRRAARRR